MGRLIYDGISRPIVVADRELAHLKVIIGTKLRRHESFMMTWVVDDGDVGRRTVWMHPAIPLQLLFDQTVMPAIDRRVIEEMMHALNASGELILDDLLVAPD